MKKNARWSVRNIFFIIAGTGSLLWFLIRVIPKPSRAAYPCMRAAAPVASAFVLYLLGLFASAALFKKSRQHYLNSRYLLASLFLVAALFAGLTTTMTADKPVYANTMIFDQPANTPTGTARGVHPGRVVWIHNPDATVKSCGNTLSDPFWLTANNNQDVIDQMVSSAIQLLTGESSNAGAWNAIFRYYNQNHGKGSTGYVPGEKIFIKINATSGWSWNTTTLEPVNYMSETSPQVVFSVLKHLVNVAGVAQSDIYVGDPQKHIYQHCYTLWHDAFPNIHYLDNTLNSSGRELAVKSTTDKIYYSDRGSVLTVTEDYLYTIFKDAEYVINIPQLKGHARAGITLFAKNHLGSQTRSNANHMHNGLVDPDGTGTGAVRAGAPLYRIQVDLMAHKLLGGKELFYLLDALWAGPEAIQKPTLWTSTPFNTDWTSSIFASQDPVAIESVGFDFLRTEYTGSNFPYPQMNGVDDYLHQAADPTLRPAGITYDPDHSATVSPLVTSLGVHEHWNNATNKQYTRNLGTGNGIELVYPAIWSGLTGTDWNNAANWWTGVVPSAATDVIVTSFSINQPVISGSSATCHHLTLLSGTSLTINPGGALTVSGNLNNSGTLTIESGGVSSSGSLIVNGTSTGYVTYNRRMPAGSAWHYIASPVILNSAPAASFYAWDETTGDWNSSATGIPGIGRGYTLQTTGNSVSFYGSIAGEVNELSTTSPYSDCDWLGGESNEYSTRSYAAGRNTHYGGGGWNLLGNPYTSALDVSKFIDYNNGDNASAGDGSFDPNYEAVYLYDGSSFSYIGIQIPGYPNTSDGFGSNNVQVGQGFFVLSHCNTSTFSFSPGTSGMQTHNTSVELKSAGVPWPGLVLTVKSGSVEKSTTVVYHEEMKTGLDPGYDVGHLSAGSELEVFTALAEDKGINFARQALPLEGSGKNIVPVGIDAEKGGDVTFSAFVNPVGNSTFYLEDRTKGIITDLSKNHYTVYLSPKTSGTGRFFIHTSDINQVPTSITEYRSPFRSDKADTGSQSRVRELANYRLPITDYREGEGEAFRIWTEGNRINVQGEVSASASMAIFDLKGRKIADHRLADADFNTFTVPVPVRGFYLVRITAGEKSTTQKVIF